MTLRDNLIAAKGRQYVSVGEAGYVPYCCRCSTMVRMHRGVDAFECRFCGLKTRIINGEDMFDQTAPIVEPPA